jgi:hypothetical protein
MEVGVLKKVFEPENEVDCSTYAPACEGRAFLSSCCWQTQIWRLFRDSKELMALATLGGTLAFKHCLNSIVIMNVSIVMIDAFCPVLVRILLLDRGL